MTRTPLSHHVPRDPRENLLWRRKTFERVSKDPGFALYIQEACHVDPVFFTNGFVWVEEPRPIVAESQGYSQSKLPFILYPYQEEALFDLLDAIENGHDLVIEKSRDMGASCLCLLSFFYCWLTWPKIRKGNFLLVSRDEKYVDELQNPKSLFTKVDFYLDNLPAFLRPQGYDRAVHRRKLHLLNPETGSVIDGEATTKRVARGDRRTAILLDEFASVEKGDSVLRATRDATSCRIFNSTPEGTNNAFYRIRQTGIKKLRLHWTAHPVKAKGLYTTSKIGTVKIIDKAGYPPDYEPILDGKDRSPWYDGECDRCASQREIAQELDIDYLGSGHQFFSADKIREIIREHARPPVVQGELECDWSTGEVLEFREDPNGNLKLWVPVKGNGKPLFSGGMVIGADVSAGTGASNSSASGYSRETREKVFELATPFLRPEAFGTQVVALCRWFKNGLHSPQLIWESNGPGRNFGSRVTTDLGWWNIYLRKNDLSIRHRVTDIPGIPPTREVKHSLLSSYRAALEGGRIINYSKVALEETLEYIYVQGGGVEHASSRDKTDPSGAQSNHGDRAMADALANKLLGERKVRPIKQEPEVPVGSLAWRRSRREESKKPKNRELGEGW